MRSPDANVNIYAVIVEQKIAVTFTAAMTGMQQAVRCHFGLNLSTNGRQAYKQHSSTQSQIATPSPCCRPAQCSLIQPTACPRGRRTQAKRRSCCLGCCASPTARRTRLVPTHPWRRRFHRTYRPTANEYPSVSMTTSGRSHIRLNHHWVWVEATACNECVLCATRESEGRANLELTYTVGIVLL